MATDRDIPSTTIRLQRRRKRTRYLVFTAMSLVLLAGCGSSSDDDGSAATITSATATTSGGTPTTEAPTTVKSVPTASTVPAVTIMDFAFNGDKLAISVGATVTWINGDPFDHSVVSKDGTFQSDTLASGAQFTHTFDTAGSFSYMCGIHPYMSGEIDVTG